ncbi:MAG: ATP-dependent Clp protease proteolytic subunit [Bacteroidetes bacterium]|nr:ATP-dependent Clp protease proteolytic subunit [Bacteroidota bacterium]
MNTIITFLNRKSNLLVAIFFLLASQIFSQGKQNFVVFDIKDEINPRMVRFTQEAFKLANAKKATHVIIHINTYGGMVDAADSIRNIILDSKVPVIAFVNENAASAGALIAISCNKIYMSKGASMGAASVVNEQGEVMPDKYQSYMRAKMRATAESRGRDPRIAEAMVDSRIYIEGVNDSGKVLTFTTSEAIKNKYCDGEVQTLNELFKIEKLDEINAVRFQPTWIDNVLGFLLNPAVSGILILIMLGGLYYEMQAPGIGFPLAAAVIAAVLYFAPHYIEGLAAHWEILIFIAGIILIGLEIFVFPGFGVTGISGIILVVISLALSLLNNVGFDFTFTPTISILQSFATVIAAMVIGIFFFIFTGKGIMHSNVFKKMVLVDSQQSDHGFNAAPDEHVTDYVGQQGKTLTILRPSGKIVVNNAILNATAENSYIEHDTAIIVSRYENGTYWVRIQV